MASTCSVLIWVEKLLFLNTYITVIALQLVDDFTLCNLSLLCSAAHGNLFVPRTRLQLGTRHFLWLVWSPGTVYHWKFARHLHYQHSKTCSRHICSHVPTSLTNCFQSTSSVLVMTLSMLLRLVNCGDILFTIIDCEILTSFVWSCCVDVS